MTVGEAAAPTAPPELTGTPLPGCTGIALARYGPYCTCEGPGFPWFPGNCSCKALISREVAVTPWFPYPMVSVPPGLRLLSRALARQRAGRPGDLQVVTAGVGVHVHDLPGEVQAGQ